MIFQKKFKTFRSKTKELSLQSQEEENLFGNGGAVDAKRTDC